MSLSRKGFLGNLGWAAAGASLGVLGRGMFSVGPRTSRDPAPPPPALLPRSAAEGPIESFAQSGEDLIVNFILGYLSLLQGMTYLDIGAFHPTQINNTYFFYQRGYRGVLVEPNVAMCEQLKAVRPKDRTLEAGIGVTSVREADYYIMTDPSWNTFSKEEAEHQVKATQGVISIKEVRKMPLLDINDVMNEHFRKAPTFVSIDAEGLHLAILKSIDFRRYRPNVICVETLASGTRQTIPEIPAFLEAQGYVVRGQTFVNTIFVDTKVI